MKYRYTKFTGDALDDVDLEDLVSKLSDLLLSSGFGSPHAMDDEELLDLVEAQGARSGGSARGVEGVDRHPLSRKGRGQNNGVPGDQLLQAPRADFEHGHMAPRGKWSPSTRMKARFSA